MKRVLRIVELFQSLQGEGANSGKLVLFVRLTGCNLRCSFCDTEFNKVELELTPQELLDRIEEGYPNCKSIVWTGGEPMLQLTDDIVAFFKTAGYWQAIESNGLIAAPIGMDYITLSPKTDLKKVADNYANREVGELRFPIKEGDPLPTLTNLPRAKHYFLSPIFDGDQVVPENIRYCYQLIEKHPKWRLSLQLHKLIGIR